MQAYMRQQGEGGGHVGGCDVTAMWMLTVCVSTHIHVHANTCTGTRKR